MQNWIIGVMSQYGYFGIALLITIENIFPPIPSELILTFGGFMTTRSDMNIILVCLFATIGSVAGACILYGLGRLLTPERLSRLLDRWGGILHVKRQDLKKAEGWFVHRGSRTVFFCRFIPVIRSLISIPAGAAHMKMGSFLLFTTLGTVIWNAVLIYLGALAGENWKSIITYVDSYSVGVWIILGAAAVCLGIWYIIKRKGRIKPRVNIQK